MPWTLDLLSLDGVSTAVSDAPFGSARVTWAADGTGAAEINLRASDVASGTWLYGRRRVLVRDGGGTPRYQGWLDRLERGGSPGDVQYRAASRGLAAILEERVVHGDFSEVATVATDVVLDLLDHLGAQTDDMTDFVEGTVTGVARTVSRYYCDGDLISDAIKELAETQDGGFAWEIDALGQFNAWVGGRGSDLSGSTTLAPEDTTDWSFVGDTEGLATYVTGLGTDPDGACGPPLVVDFDPLRTTYGRREVVIESDSLDEDEVLGETQEELRARIASRGVLKTAWIEGDGPWAFGAVWIGDVVDVALGAEFGGNADMRCTSVSITLDPGTHEFIEMEWEMA